MKLGEKLQRLRRQSGLSQEQLAGQLGVSRQAVSKWELDETMPDTENVIQLSRLFGVSCDYLLLDEAGGPDASRPEPPAPGETHLTEQGWMRNALIVCLAVCAIGLILAVGSWFYPSAGILRTVGLIIQVVGMVLFELAAPHMGEKKYTARMIFYVTACWLVPPVLFLLIPGIDLMAGLYYSLFLAVAVTAITVLIYFFMSEKK